MTRVKREVGFRAVAADGERFDVWPDDPDLELRLDGIVERLCEHGVGHPIGHIWRWREEMAVHSCDGCCQHWTDREDSGVDSAWDI